MPTVTRFLVRIGLVCLAVFAAMLALAHLVEPHRRTMVEPIDAAVFEALRPEELPAAAAAVEDDQDPDRDPPPPG